MGTQSGSGKKQEEKQEGTGGRRAARAKALRWGKACGTETVRCSSVQVMGHGKGTGKAGAGVPLLQLKASDQCDCIGTHSWR